VHSDLIDISTIPGFLIIFDYFWHDPIFLILEDIIFVFIPPCPSPLNSLDDYERNTNGTGLDSRKECGATTTDRISRNIFEIMTIKGFLWLTN
jgi:hypothetical protein